MKTCAFCNKPIVVLFHRNFNVFCNEEHADLFGAVGSVSSDTSRHAEAPFDAEEIHWCEVAHNDGSIKGGGTP